MHDDPNCARRGCTEQACIDRLRAHKTLLKKRQRHGLQNLVPVEALQKQVAHWRDQGYSYPEIAAAAGMNENHLRRIMNGGYDRVTPRTVKRIMEARPTRESGQQVRRSGLHVSALGSRRRLEALATLGYSQTEIADLMELVGGVPTGSRWCSDVLVGLHANVYRNKHDALVKVYEHVGLRQSEHPESWYVRRRAAGHRYVPPLAWEDIDMDDPEAKPEGVKHPTSRRWRKRYEVKEAVA